MINSHRFVHIIKLEFKASNASVSTNLSIRWDLVAWEENEKHFTKWSLMPCRFCNPHLTVYVPEGVLQPSFSFTGDRSSAEEVNLTRHLGPRLGAWQCFVDVSDFWKRSLGIDAMCRLTLRSLESANRSDLTLGVARLRDGQSKAQCSNVLNMIHPEFKQRGLVH